MGSEFFIAFFIGVVVGVVGIIVVSCAIGDKDDQQNL